MRATRASIQWARGVAAILLCAGSSLWAVAARITIDFEGVNTAAQGYVNDPSVINGYLSAFGVSTPDGPTVLNARTYAVYDNSPTTNVITGGTGRNPTVLAFEFEGTASDVTFVRVGTIGANSPSGTIAGDWSATAYGDDGTAIATVGEGLVSFFGDRPPVEFSLPGTGIKRIVFRGYDHGFAGINTPHITLLSFEEVESSVVITSPPSGVTPQSQFVALAGTARPGASIQIRRNDVAVGNVSTDAEGVWEALVWIVGIGGVAEIRACDGFDCSDKLRVNDTAARTGRFDAGPAIHYDALLPLRKADLLVTAARHSFQYKFYGPNSTHVALYLGGDAVGTPIVGEAVPQNPDLRAWPLERTTVWTDADRIAGFTLRTPVNNATREAFAQRAHAFVASGASYWRSSAFNLIVKLGRRNIVDIFTILSQIEAMKLSTTEMQCATFVWHSYGAKTSPAGDISLPNLMTAEGLLSDLPELVVEELRERLIVPDTYVRSPKFRQLF